jgi:hypothetical protein
MVRGAPGLNDQRGDHGGGRNFLGVLGPAGNPTAENLFNAIGLLQAETGVRLEVRAVASAA